MFRLVLVTVLLVVQMVGSGKGNPYSGVVVAFGGAFGGVLESWPGVLSAVLWLVPFVRAVWLLRQGSVALVTMVCWGLVPVVAVRC